MRMTIKEVIQKAINGGYEPQPVTVLHHWLLDPLFWQALGKAMGWDGKHKNISYCSKCRQNNPELIGGKGGGRFGEIVHNTKCRGAIVQYTIEPKTWEQQWHQLIDHLSEGGTLEEWFLNL